jgi:hypothetical protein
MAARKGKPGLSLSITSPAEEQMAKFMRGSTPWIVWLGGIPLACAAFRLTAVATHHVGEVAAGLGAATLLVTWVTARTTHARGMGRVHHVANAAGALAVITLVAWLGPGAGRGSLAVAYAVAGLAACLVWNVRYTSHHDNGPEDVLTAKRQRGHKRVDLAYVVRVAAGRVRVIRPAAEKVGKVIPAATGPWREAPRVILGDVISSAPAITAGDPDHVDPAAAAAAADMWRAILRNWRDLAAHKVPDLNGARMRALDVKPWRIRTEIALVRGVQTPKIIFDARELMASQNALPLSSIIATPSRKRHDRVFLDFVLEDTLAVVRWWPGPAAAGQSIAAAPTRFGLYEDRVYAERFGPAITADMARALGRDEKNLTHLMAEGMNGSGKSSAFRVLVTDGATRIDAEDWLIDTVKKLQTFGQLAGAFQWFATTVPEARALVRFLADVVIGFRADYLGSHGYDNWEPGCGLPYLRVWVEEGGIVANELDKLDAVLNSARSAGVEINLSVQRAHHALVDTNVRAAFGETMSFGCKGSDDVFAMPDELRDAGADPSQWGNRQPGKNFYAGAELDLDRQLMPDRAFNVDASTCREIIAKYAPLREAWIAEHCPDWRRLLEAADKRGVWAKRTTGAAVLAKIAGAEGRRAAAEIGAEPASPYEPQILAEADEIIEAELMPLPDDDDEEPEITMDELDLDPETAAGVAEDAGIDPRAPLPPFDPADSLDFGKRPETDRPREESVAALRSYLMNKGEGFEFAPRDIYDEVCPALGRGGSWVRGELLRLADDGMLQHDRAEGVYRVLGPRLRLASAAV